MKFFNTLKLEIDKKELNKNSLINFSVKKPLLEEEDSLSLGLVYEKESEINHIKLSSELAFSFSNKEKEVYFINEIQFNSENCEIINLGAISFKENSILNSSAVNMKTWSFISLDEGFDHIKNILKNIEIKKIGHFTNLEHKAVLNFDKKKTYLCALEFLAKVFGSFLKLRFEKEKTICIFMKLELEKEKTYEIMENKIYHKNFISSFSEKEKVPENFELKKEEKIKEKDGKRILVIKEKDFLNTEDKKQKKYECSLSELKNQINLNNILNRLKGGEEKIRIEEDFFKIQDINIFTFSLKAIEINKRFKGKFFCLEKEFILDENGQSIILTLKNLKE